MKSNRELKANLIRAGIRQKDVAESIGVSRSAVCRVLAGKLKSTRIKSAITASIREARGKAA